MAPSPVPADQRTEDWLTSRGVKFSPARLIPLGKIKHAESRHNQARAEALTSEVVDRYTTAVKAGETFPPIVVYKSGSGFMIVDGNHRDEAHVRASCPSIAAYEIDPATSTDLVELLTVEANVRHGQPTDTAWRLRQAIHLIATGKSMELVTSATGVTKSQIDVAKRIGKADERAHRMGLYGWTNLNALQRQNLATISSDPVFAACAEVVIDTSMTGVDIATLTRQIRAAASEADALRIVGEVGDQRRTHKSSLKNGQRNRMHNPRTRVLTALGAMNALVAGELPRIFKTEDERKEVARRCGDAALVLMEMEEVLRDALGS